MRAKNAPGASGSLQDGMWCDLRICNSVRNDTKKQTEKSALFRANLREQKLSPALSTVESNMDEVAEHISRVSMGLTLNRQTAQNLTVNCQNRIILTVTRQREQLFLVVVRSQIYDFRSFSSSSLP